MHSIEILVKVPEVEDFRNREREIKGSSHQMANLSGYQSDKSKMHIQIMAVYGRTIKELIVEEFGDGIMSAIDFNLTVAREKSEEGDRVSLVLSGKFLPYKSF